MQPKDDPRYRRWDTPYGPLWVLWSVAFQGTSSGLIVDQYVYATHGTAVNVEGFEPITINGVDYLGLLRVERSGGEWEEQHHHDAELRRVEYGRWQDSGPTDTARAKWRALLPELQSWVLLNERRAWRVTRELDAILEERGKIGKLKAEHLEELEELGTFDKAIAERAAELRRSELFHHVGV